MRIWSRMMSRGVAPKRGVAAERPWTQVDDRLGFMMLAIGTALASVSSFSGAVCAMLELQLPWTRTRRRL